jgi:hypothetical protein
VEGALRVFWFDNGTLVTLRIPVFRRVASQPSSRHFLLVWWAFLIKRAEMPCEWPPEGFPPTSLELRLRTDRLLARVALPQGSSMQNLRVLPNVYFGLYAMHSPFKVLDSLLSKA